MIPRKIDKERLFREALGNDARVIVVNGIRNQLRKGMVDATDASFQQKQYTPVSKAYRRKRGKQTAFIDLKMTGALYRGIRVMTTPSTLRTSNTSSTYTSLTNAYPWAKNSMNVSRATMDKFVGYVSRKIARRIL